MNFLSTAFVLLMLPFIRAIGSGTSPVINPKLEACNAFKKPITEIGGVCERLIADLSDLKFHITGSLPMMAMSVMKFELELLNVESECRLLVMHLDREVEKFEKVLLANTGSFNRAVDKLGKLSLTDIRNDYTFAKSLEEVKPPRKVLLADTRNSFAFIESLDREITRSRRVSLTDTENNPAFTKSLDTEIKKAEKISMANTKKSPVFTESLDIIDRRNGLMNIFMKNSELLKTKLLNAINTCNSITCTMPDNLADGLMEMLRALNSKEYDELANKLAGAEEACSILAMCLANIRELYDPLFVPDQQKRRWLRWANPAKAKE